jgi:hypothetical protein
MDLELRQLRQAVVRLRTDLEKEQSQREKAESAALRATDITDVRMSELHCLYLGAHQTEYVAL